MVKSKTCSGQIRQKRSESAHLYYSEWRGVRLCSSADWQLRTVRKGVGTLTYSYRLHRSLVIQFTLPATVGVMAVWSRSVGRWL